MMMIQYRTYYLTDVTELLEYLEDISTDMQGHIRPDDGPIVRSHSCEQYSFPASSGPRAHSSSRIQSLCKTPWVIDQELFEICQVDESVAKERLCIVRIAFSAIAEGILSSFKKLCGEILFSGRVGIYSCL
jgi:hypothetical protein